MCETKNHRRIGRAVIPCKSCTLKKAGGVWLWSISKEEEAVEAGRTLLRLIKLAHVSCSQIPCQAMTITKWNAQRRIVSTLAGNRNQETLLAKSSLEFVPVKLCYCSRTSNVSLAIFRLSVILLLLLRSMMGVEPLNTTGSWHVILWMPLMLSRRTAVGVTL